MRDARAEAVHARLLGWGVALVEYDTKRAIDKGWQNLDLGVEEIDRRMRRSRLNYGLLMRTERYQAVVIDVDGDDEGWLERNGVESGMHVISPNGEHIYGVI